MRAAFIVVLVLMAASPSHASKSCMTMTEARAQFATSHLYWHGSDHCWDATPPRHRIVRRGKPKDEREARDDKATPDDTVAPVKREPKWRNAMSEMLPPETPIVDTAPPQFTVIATPGLDWLDRWVDITQIAPPAFLRRTTELASADVSPSLGQKADPMVTPVRLILVFLSIVVILAVIELLFRNAIHDRLD